ncbi:hypothetical protein BDW02DRAFT_45777 [Decorospora gaudefroyi]|uniref:Uncharacterized protein n=1 Tax=Decorospora gaudefroyi TaxID=184978 RepID=A0A6A5K993_9PLEO|nr:hypothetical protein BDW02DRAFT_45777 [Decorospora gaudefroyi]
MPCPSAGRAQVVVLTGRGSPIGHSAQAASLTSVSRRSLATSGAKRCLRARPHQFISRCGRRAGPLFRARVLFPSLLTGLPCPVQASAAIKNPPGPHFITKTRPVASTATSPHPTATLWTPIRSSPATAPCTSLARATRYCTIDTALAPLGLLRTAPHRTAPHLTW